MTVLPRQRKGSAAGVLLCAGKGGKLILPKRALGPVTVAAAEEKWRVDFD